MKAGEGRVEGCEGQVRKNKFALRDEEDVAALKAESGKRSLVLFLFYCHFSVIQVLRFNLI